MLPAVAYLELAREAAGAGVTAFSDVVWLSPVTSTRELSVRVVSADDERVEFRTGDRLHAEARLVREPSTAVSGVLDLDGIRHRCMATVPGETCYTTLDTLGLRYGASMRALVRVDHNEREALAELRLEDLGPPSGLHPALMDAAFQSLVVFSDESGVVPSLQP